MAGRKNTREASTDSKITPIINSLLNFIKSNPLNAEFVFFVLKSINPI